MKRGLPVFAIACAAMLCGCASPRERLYTLVGPEPPAPVPAPTLHVVVGPVTLPDAVDRPQLVVRQSPARLVALEQERWAEPLREAVPRVLAESIASRLRSVSVVTSLAGAAIVPDLRIAVEIRRLEAIPGQTVIVEAHWWLRSGTQQSTQEGTSVARVTVHGRPNDYESLVAAEAAAFAEIGGDLAGAIETQAARRPRACHLRRLHAGVAAYLS
jgi:uncharacterized protein